MARLREKGRNAELVDIPALAVFVDDRLIVFRQQHRISIGIDEPAVAVGIYVVAVLV